MAHAVVFAATLPVISISASLKRLRNAVRTLCNIFPSSRAACVACATEQVSSHLEYAGPKYAKSMRF